MTGPAERRAPPRAGTHPPGERRSGLCHRQPRHGDRRRDPETGERDRRADRRQDQIAGWAEGAAKAIVSTGGGGPEQRRLSRPKSTREEAISDAAAANSPVSAAGPVDYGIAVENPEGVGWDKLAYKCWPTASRITRTTMVGRRFAARFCPTLRYVERVLIVLRNQEEQIGGVKPLLRHGAVSKANDHDGRMAEEGPGWSGAAGPQTRRVRRVWAEIVAKEVAVRRGDRRTFAETSVVTGRRTYSAPPVRCRRGRGNDERTFGPCHHPAAVRVVHRLHHH